MSYFSRGWAFKSKWNFKQIRLELGQLTGTAQTVGIHEIRYIGFRIAVRTGMQVQHELDLCVVLTRERTAHHRKARTGDFRSGLGGVWDIRHAQQDVVELVLQRVEARLTLLELLAELGHLRHQRRDVFARGLG